MKGNNKDKAGNLEAKIKELEKYINETNTNLRAFKKEKEELERALDKKRSDIEIARARLEGYQDLLSAYSEHLEDLGGN